MDENENKFQDSMNEEPVTPIANENIEQEVPEVLTPPIKVKRTGKQNLIDLVIGLALIVGSTFLVLFSFNSMGMSGLVALFFTIIVNSFVTIRGFRKSRPILAICAMIFLSPAVFIMLAFGACGILIGGFN